MRLGANCVRWAKPGICVYISGRVGGYEFVVRRGQFRVASSISATLSAWKRSIFRKSSRCFPTTSSRGSLDRLSREGVLKTLVILNKLSGYGVQYRSLQEKWLDSMGDFKDAIVGIIATIAKFESDRMSSRVRSGLARARAEGKVLGRPKAVLDRSKLEKMRAEGMSLREIGAATGRSAMTIQRILAAGERKTA